MQFADQFTNHKNEYKIQIKKNIPMERGRQADTEKNPTGGTMQSPVPSG